MLQKIYSVYSDDLDDVQLFIEAGNNHIACWCKKTGEQTLQAFEFFQCDDYKPENFEALIDSTRLYSRLLTMPVNGTKFFWSTDEVLCVPKEKLSDAFLKDSFELLKGPLPESNIYSALTDYCAVAWRLASQQQSAAQQCFRGAAFTHQYASLLSFLKSDNNKVYLFFYPHYFTLIVFKQDKLQLMQTRKYIIAEDVLYFILDVYKQLAIDKKTEIFCGGFIEEKSTLFGTLYQYLQGLQLMKADEMLYATNEFKEYSSHYFLPYINYVV